MRRLGARIQLYADTVGNEPPAGPVHLQERRDGAGPGGEEVGPPLREGLSSGDPSRCMQPTRQAVTRVLHHKACPPFPD